MSLLHPGLLYGLLLACIPVVLHLLMRARPRHYDFPALRLLENIQRQSVQRLRLRHLGLLLLRILLIVCLVLAVARPTLPAANYSLTATEWTRLLGILGAAALIYLAGKKFWADQSRSTQKTAATTKASRLRTGIFSGGLLLLLLLVVWPYQQRVRSEMKAPGDQRQLNVPVAAVLLFDVSASMGYQQSNQSRLSRAFELALQQARDFPASSRVAVTDNAQSEPVQFLNDLQGAVTRLQRSESRQPEDASLNLNDRLIAAINLQQTDRDRVLAESGGEQAGSDRFLREIYIYTDLSRSAWSLEQADRLKADLERVPWLRCYLIDVGIDNPVNYSLSQLSLSRERTVQGTQVRLTADVHNQSTDSTEGVLEFYLEDHSGQAVKRDQQVLTLLPEQTTQVSFSFPADAIGPIQGQLRLTNSDPLEKDNQLPFTVQVEARPKICLLTENPEEAFVWQQALAPDELVKRGVNQYDVERLTPQQFVNRYTSSLVFPFDAVYLINVSRLPEAAWGTLRRFVESGGGLGIVLGNARIDAGNYREAGQASWLPALPLVHSRSDPAVTWDVTRTDHPVFAYLKSLDAVSLFASASVNRFWKMEPTPQGDVLSRFHDPDQSPSIVAGGYGQGRVVMIGTAVDLTGAAEQRNWSELARLGWIYAAWADQTTKYLRGNQAGTINRAAGETVSLTVVTPQDSRTALLQLPGLRQGRVELPYRGPFLSLTARQHQDATTTAATASERLGVDRVGNYRLLFPEARSYSTGFSIHLPNHETNLTRLSAAELDGLFGPDRWQVSRSYEELERSVLLGRIGQEAYSLLVTILLIFFVGEHLVANLFYGRRTD